MKIKYNKNISQFHFHQKWNFHHQKGEFYLFQYLAIPLDIHASWNNFYNIISWVNKKIL